MSKGKTIQRISNKKRGRPRVRFNFWFMVILFMVTFVAFFVLYMVSANINDDFFGDDLTAVVTEKEKAQTPTSPTSTGTETSSPSASKTKVTNPVASSAAQDVSYLDSCMLISGKGLLGMKNVTSLKNVFGNDTLNAYNCNSTKVETASGVVSISEAVGLLKPANVYIMLEFDPSVAIDESISSYVSLISAIHTASPDVGIYVMEQPPVLNDTETVSNEIINNYNSQLLSMADRLGVYYLSSGLDLKSAAGALDEQYWSAETGTLTDAAFQLIVGYILSHTV